MRNASYRLLQASNVTNQTSAKIDANQIYAISVHAVQGDSTAAGSVKFQASNDPTNSNNLAVDFTPTNWVDVPSATATVTAGSAALVTISQNAYRWLRVVWTETTPGTTTITLNINSIGV